MSPPDDRPGIFVSLLRWRRPLIAVPVLTAFVVVSATLLLPNVYRARATLLPPYEEGGLSMLGGLAGLVGGGGGMSLPFLSTPSDVYATILSSRTAVESVVDSLGLVQYFESSSRDAAVRTFSEKLAVSVGSEGTITVAFTDENPDTAASIVNALVVELDRINRRTGAARARATREFTGEQLTRTVAELREAEDSLAAFQSRTGAVDPEVLARAAVDATAEVMTALRMTQVELGMARALYGENHVAVRQLVARERELKRQLTRLEGSSAGGIGLSMGLADLPELGVEYVRRMRKVKVLEAVFEFLTAQHEQARVQEQKDTPSVQLLDHAVAPTKKHSPKRATLAIISAFLSLIVLAPLVVMLERVRYRRSVDPRFDEVMDEIVRGLGEDARKVRDAIRITRRRK
jgi:tyrosine-protein kinase Etk/Wzc